MPRVTVEVLLDQLDATCNAWPRSEIRRRAEEEVSKAAEFISTFETSIGASLDSEQRADLADHLWNEHVDSSTCSSCPFEAVLDPWYAAVEATTYWPEWQSLYERNGNKRPRWSAEKKLSIYLFLRRSGFRSKPLARKQHGDRFILKEGNNRVSMLAAMGHRDMEINVQ